MTIRTVERLGGKQAWPNAHFAVPGSDPRATRTTGTPTWRPARTSLSTALTGTILPCLRSIEDLEAVLAERLAIIKGKRGVEPDAGTSRRQHRKSA